MAFDPIGWIQGYQALHDGFARLKFLMLNGSNWDGNQATLGVRTFVSDTEPSSPNEGDLWLDTSVEGNLQIITE